MTFGAKSMLMIEVKPSPYISSDIVEFPHPTFNRRGFRRLGVVEGVVVAGGGATHVSRCLKSRGLSAE